MWTVVKIRADYEGWWLFEDWPQKIVEQSEFNYIRPNVGLLHKCIKP